MIESLGKLAAERGRRMAATAAPLTLSKPIAVAAVLGFLVVEAVSLAFGRVTHVGPIVMLVPAIVALAFAITTISPISGCAVLIAVCFVDRPEIPIGSVHMRVPELTAVGLSAAVLSRRVRSGRSLRDLAHALSSVPLFWPILAFLATNYVSILFSLDVRRSVELNLIYTVLAAGYVGIVMACRGRDDCHKLCATLFVAAIVEAAFGLVLLWVGSTTHQVMYGIQFDPGTRFFDAMGSLQDANYFGSFMITPFVIGISVIVIYVGRSHRRGRLAWVGLGLLLLSVAIAASLTRGAWLGLAGALVTYFAVAVGRGARVVRIRVAAIAAFGFAVVAAGLFIMGTVNLGAGGLASREALAGSTRAPSSAAATSRPPGNPNSPASRPVSTTLPVARSTIVVRIESAFDLTKGSTQGRLYTAGLALKEWRANPIFGVGTGSYNSARTGPDHPWILNMFLTALHDTGLIGLVVLVWLVVSYLGQLGVAAWQHQFSYPGLLSVSLLAGSVGLFIAFQASTGMILMYPWMVMALGMSIALQSRNNTTQAAEQGTPFIA